MSIDRIDSIIITEKTNVLALRERILKVSLHSAAFDIYSKILPLSFVDGVD